MIWPKYKGPGSSNQDILYLATWDSVNFPHNNTQTSMCLLVSFTDSRRKDFTERKRSQEMNAMRIQVLLVLHLILSLRTVHLLYAYFNLT